MVGAGIVVSRSKCGCTVVEDRGRFGLKRWFGVEIGVSGLGRRLVIEYRCS